MTAYSACVQPVHSIMCFRGSYKQIHKYIYTLYVWIMYYILLLKRGCYQTKKKKILKTDRVIIVKKYAKSI